MPSTRIEIADAARYQSDEWGDPQYYVLWKGRMFTTLHGTPADTGHLIDQVQAHERMKEGE